jgi:hypothetical protein
MTAIPGTTLNLLIVNTDFRFYIFRNFCPIFILEPYSDKQNEGTFVIAKPISKNCVG